MDQKIKGGDIQDDGSIFSISFITFLLSEHFILMPLPTEQQLTKHLQMGIYLMVPLIFIHYQKFRNLGCIRALNQFSYLLPCSPVLLLMSLLYSIVSGEALGQLVLFDEIQ